MDALLTPIEREDRKVIVKFQNIILVLIIAFDHFLLIRELSALNCCEQDCYVEYPSDVDGAFVAYLKLPSSL